MKKQILVRKFVKSNSNVLEDKIKENKVMHAVNSSNCRFVLEAQVFAVSVAQKVLDYFVITLRINQLEVY